jgi:8-oxo-dGTP pyrophosphatase MutT (NUDIX family)
MKSIRRRAGVILCYNNKVLLVLGKISNKWSFPKGELMEHESFIEGAMRELYEETGIVMDTEILENAEKIVTEYTTYFKVNIEDMGFLPNPKIIDKKEIKKCRFINILNLNNLKVNHDIKFVMNNNF